MNYIITKKCDKGCPYCFASESRSEDPSSLITLEMFNEMLNKDNSDFIKLLGGEPTQHPEFESIVDAIANRGKKITLISNFLFREEILNIILSIMEKTRIGFLINATDLDIKNRMEIWKKNYNSIYKKLYRVDLEEEMSVGITLEYDKTVDYYIKYFNFLKNSVLKIEKLRISINFPGKDKDKDFGKVINNKEIGNKIITLIQLCLDNFITPTLDCIIYPCMFKNKEELKLVSKFMVNLEFKCQNAPSDLFSDKTISYCYPLKEKLKVSYDKYDNDMQVYDDLLIRYKIIENMVKKPEECIECDFFKKEICNGPCLAFYDLSEINIGVNL